MKFKELLSTIEWKDIKESLLETYADASSGIDEYKTVFHSLFSLFPDSTKFRICIKEVFEEDFDDNPYADVFGKNGTLNKELPDFKYMNQQPDSEFANSEVKYALEFVEWEEWLSMEIDEDTLRNYSKPDIAAHCLWEMTSLGYDQVTIKEQKDELDHRVKEVKNMSDDEKKEKLILWEEVKRDMELDVE